jgi:hypothetical protein
MLLGIVKSFLVKLAVASGLCDWVVPWPNYARVWARCSDDGVLLSTFPVPHQ